MKKQEKVVLAHQLVVASGGVAIRAIKKMVDTDQRQQREASKQMEGKCDRRTRKEIQLLAELLCARILILEFQP